MDYSEMLKTSAKKFNSIVCMGMDPVLEKIPLQGTTEQRIVEFYAKILEKAESMNALPGSVKPNYAFYAQHGFDGLHALKKVIDKAKEFNLPVCLDAKRGDIGKTSKAYAKEVYEFWGADCVTLAPYMGADNINQFTEYSKSMGKGMYILNRTSNPSAVELQNLLVDGQELFLKVSDKICEWGQDCNGNVGAVVGATSPQELEKIVRHFAEKKAKVPLLIPGVGAQGGSAKDVAEILKNTGYDLGLARINSSSGINYAYQKTEGKSFDVAAAEAILKLNNEIGFE